MHVFRHLVIGLILAFAGQASLRPLLPADEPAALHRFTFEEPHMGTRFRIVLYAADEATAKDAAKAAFARVAELNRIMSDYLADSELMQLCKHAGGEPVKVSQDLFDVLQKAQEVAQMSGGAFDVSVGPMVRLWRVARKTKKLPDPEELKRALAKVDYRNIRLDAERRTVQLLVLGMLLDLGGIAKGYAADAILEVLRSRGITRALAAAGGDIAVGDAPPNAKGWKIGITPLLPESKTPQYVLLKNAAVSTAGDANQYVEIDGVRYSHIVDPKTGMGLVGRRSVTVIAPRGVWSDGLDTAACVMGVDNGLKMIENRSDCAALFMEETESGVVTTKSKRFDQFMWKE
jgi:thiamine biosynthesis lipoprotein